MEKLNAKTIFCGKLLRLRLPMIVATLIFFPTSHVYGAWQLVTKSPRGDTYYLDSDIETKAGVSQVWGLVDLSEAIEGSTSVKRLYQFDCVKGKLRVNQRLAFAEKGGQGKVISLETASGHWMYPDPESINEKLVLKICFDKKENSASSKH
jgi:hypothetical protein